MSAVQVLQPAVRCPPCSPFKRRYFASLRELPSIDPLPEDYVPLKKRGPGHLDLRPQAEITTYQFHDMVSLVGKLEMASNVRI